MQFADEIKTYTCVRCPLGCQLEVSFDEAGAITEITGYSCKLGKEYAAEEAVDPRRTLTTLIYVAGCGEPLSVKTARGIPKGRLREVLAAIRALQVSAPVEAGEVLIQNVCDTGIDVVATKSVCEG